MTTVRLAYLNLEDRWPGQPNPNLSEPTAGWDNTTDNFTTTSAAQATPYPVGTKIMSHSANAHAPGFYTMMYLMFHDFSSAPINATDFSLKGAWCAHHDGSNAEKYTTDVSSVPYYVVSKCYTAIASDMTTLGTPIALPCATLDGDGTATFVTGYGDAYGWFWVGGVPPLDDVSHFRGALDNTRGFDMTTDILCRKGQVYFDMTADQSWLTSCDISESGQADASKGEVPFPHAYLCISSK
jgi:hypothetical protein